MSDVISELEKREFIDQKTSEDLKKICQKPIKLYIGFDPTASSLHLGNLVGIVAMKWFQKHGHKPIALIGQATARIGDPSGKSQERPFLDEEQINNNSKSIKEQLSSILKNDGQSPEFINNDDWFQKINYINFLRDIGKYFRVNVMLCKECVKTRLESEEGISYTEFSYQIMQAFDFYHLNKNEDVLLQLGGSDQWGNITAGIELTRKLSNKSVYGMTFPLLTRSDGKKFGKSEKGAIFLSDKLLSPYEFYQYLFRLPDADVIKLMKMLTFMDLEEISKYENLMKQDDYIPNTAQKKLAEEVTRFVHGEKGLEIAKKVTLSAKPGAKTKLDGETLKEIAKDMPNCNLSKKELINEKYCAVITKVGLCASKGEATKLVKNNGAYLNNEKVIDVNLTIEDKHFIDGKYLLFGKGKKQKFLVIVK
jgi:tyrosyl-tRNA synthetase